jgi:hypothetical protein
MQRPETLIILGFIRREKAAFSPLQVDCIDYIGFITFYIFLLPFQKEEVKGGKRNREREMKEEY